jgi:hypothetical protein
MPTNPDQKPAKRRSGGGSSYIVLAVVVAGIFAAVTFAPDSLRTSLGIKPKPANEGDAPQVTNAVNTGDGADRGDAAAVTFEPRKLANAPVKTATTTTTTTTTTAAVVKQTFPDEAKASQILTEARTAFTALQWKAAESAAKRVAALDCSPLTKLRANDIATNAPRLDTLFKSLPESDELTRNWETNPGVVRLVGSGQPTLAVPLEGDTATPVAIEENPMGFIAKMRTRGPVWFMVEGSKGFIKSALEDDRIGKVEEVDVKALINQRAAELDGRIAKVRNSGRPADPTDWYELGKFAYRNRYDAKVAELLNRAITLEPDLVTSVREEKAGLLAASMMVHLKNGNQSSAAVFLNIINKRYADTSEGKQAKLMYEGNREGMLAAARAAEQAKAEAERRRREELENKAKASEAAGDAEGAKDLKKDAKVEEPAAAPVVAGDVNEAQADTMKEELRKKLATAVQSPTAPASQKIFYDGVTACQKMIAVYEKAMKGGNASAGLEEKMVEARKLMFLCRKSQIVGGH